MSDQREELPPTKPPAEGLPALYEWEKVRESSDYQSTQRMRLPTGWVYMMQRRTQAGEALSAVFVPITDWSSADEVLP